MVKIFNQEWSKAELMCRVGQMEQIAGIRLVEASEGKARGSRLLDVWTGSGLRFQVNAERALDLSCCEFQGLPLAWRSPVGDSHPAYYEPEGLGWLRSFSGGLLTTCGLDQFGSPSEENGTAFGLHGRVSNLPAYQVNHRAYWEGEHYWLEISAEVRQAVIFGENLVLRRKITTRLGSNAILVDDLVTNEGFESVPHMLLYHFNLGFPLVSEHSRLKIPAEEIHPRDEAARAGLSTWDSFQAPSPGYQEQVFVHRPLKNSAGKASVELQNPTLGISLRWQYTADTLPYLMEWKMMGSGAYVVGIEPANCNGLGGRTATRANGWLPVLEPGESRAYQLNLEIIPLEGSRH